MLGLEMKEKIREEAVERLLKKAPLGSSCEHVAQVLKEQGYDSTWKLDDRGILLATGGTVSENFTWKTGPASWELLLYCSFEEKKLTGVEATLRVTGL